VGRQPGERGVFEKAGLGVVAFEEFLDFVAELFIVGTGGEEVGGAVLLGECKCGLEEFFDAGPVVHGNFLSMADCCGVFYGDCVGGSDFDMTAVCGELSQVGHGCARGSEDDGGGVSGD
jgi:hypothetical protein